METTGMIREDRVGELLAAKRAADADRDAEGALLDLARGSTSTEISEAVARSGQGAESWARIGRPPLAARRP